MWVCQWGTTLRGEKTRPKRLSFFPFSFSLPVFFWIFPSDSDYSISNDQRRNRSPPESLCSNIAEVNFSFQFSPFSLSFSFPFRDQNISVNQSQSWFPKLLPVPSKPLNPLEVRSLVVITLHWPWEPWPNLTNGRTWEESFQEVRIRRGKGICVSDMVWFLLQFSTFEFTIWTSLSSIQFGSWTINADLELDVCLSFLPFYWLWNPCRCFIFLIYSLLFRP